MSSPSSGVRQVVSEMRSPQCSPDPVIVDLVLRESERDVVPHRARDQGDGLRNVRDQAGIAAHDLPRRQSADPDRTRRGLHNPEDGIGKRGLAASRRADDCKGSAGSQREGDPGDGRAMGARVVHRQVPDHDLKDEFGPVVMPAGNLRCVHYTGGCPAASPTSCAPGGGLPS